MNTFKEFMGVSVSFSIDLPPSSATLHMLINIKILQYIIILSHCADHRQFPAIKILISILP